jgi:Mu transposase, C-terminal
MVFCGRNNMASYPMNEFMISDELEPYPVNIWHWGVKNNYQCFLHWQDSQIIRQNFLPTETAFVSRNCISFKKLHYSCDLAIRENWFVSAKNKGGWKITVAYDPRIVNNIYIRLRPGQPMEPCYLLDIDDKFLGCEWSEVCDYYRRMNEKKQAATTRKIQNRAKLNATAIEIIKLETEQTEKFCNGRSKRSRLKDMREHRSAERIIERKEQAWDLTQNSTDSQSTQSVPNEVVVQLQRDL